MASATTSVLRTVVTTLFWFTVATAELVPSGHNGDRARAVNPCSGSLACARASRRARSPASSGDGAVKRLRP